MDSSKLSNADKLSYETLVGKLKNKEYKKIVVMTGAGISVSAGIPDFRSPKTGLYANLAKYNLPYPEAIFTIDFFKEQPEAFYTLAMEFLDLTKFKPTPTHYFFKLLQDKGLLFQYLTQNIDNLEEKAGFDMSKVTQAHGANRGAHCAVCKKEQNREQMLQCLSEGKVYYCSDNSCKGPVKPHITFFGETLPHDFFNILQVLPQADLLIVVGTALAVAPFNKIVELIPDNVDKVLINLENTYIDFDNQDEYPKRLFLKGKCDEVLQKLANDLGWT